MGQVSVKLWVKRVKLLKALDHIEINPPISFKARKALQAGFQCAIAAGWPLFSTAQAIRRAIFEIGKKRK